MRILLAVASRHGATMEIGERLADSLSRRGYEVALQAAREVEGVGGHDAVVIGSAVYVGRWLQDARELIERHQAELRERPVWLFSSGPVGDPPKPEADPVDVAAMVEMTGARGHKLFAGRIDRGRLGLGERAVVSLVRAAEGDFRDWAEVEGWAGEIARLLHPSAPVATALG